MDDMVRELPPPGAITNHDRPAIPEGPLFSRRFFVGLVVSAALGGTLAEVINDYNGDDSAPTPVDP
jgi:hypothetical protein